MFKNLLAFMFVFITTSICSLYADPSSSDVIKVELDGQIYYYFNLSLGIIGDDLCYQGWEDNKSDVSGVDEVFEYYQKNRDSITLFTDYFVIETHQFYGNGSWLISYAGQKKINTSIPNIFIILFRL